MTYGNMAILHRKKVTNIISPFMTYNVDSFIPIFDRIPLRDTKGVLASIRYTNPKKQSPKPPLRYCKHEKHLNIIT